MIIDTRTGKVLMTDEQLIADAKKWLKSKSNREWIKAIKKLEEGEKEK